MVVDTKLACPNCGAPLGVREGQRHVICTYCSGSLRVDAATAAGPASPAPLQLTRENVSKEDIERLKQLVLDGRRDEAVAHYEKAAAVSRAEADEAINEMLVAEFWVFTRRMPMNALGFLLYAGLIGLGGGSAVWGALQIPESPGWLVVVSGGALLAVWLFIRLVPIVISTLVCAFGAEGQARVLRVAVLRTDPKRSAAIVQVMFEVEPARGGKRFTDEEILFVAETGLAKLQIGNVIPVRYDEPGRTRVFPTKPITVLATAGGSYRS